jgi:hypothetical protein
MQAVVETPGYLKKAQALFTDEERKEIIDTFAANPEMGDLIPGTGGFRKIRVARRGSGKRGGARVIYFLRNANLPLYLVQVYAKNEKENLSKTERNNLARLAETIFK